MPDSLIVRVEGLDQILRSFNGLKVNVPRIVATSINSTAKHVRTLATKDIMDKWNIQKKKDVLSTMTITNANATKLTAEIKMQSKPLSLAKFGMTKVAIKKKTKPKTITRFVKGKQRTKTTTKIYTRYGVKVALLRGEQQQLLEHAFPAIMQSGHRGAFLRRTTRSLPILEKKSITPSSMWADYIEQHVIKARPYLRARIIGQLQALLAKQGNS